MRKKLAEVEFKDVDTWYVGASKGVTTTQVNSSYLDKSTAAYYLVNTHNYKYWTKQ